MKKTIVFLLSLLFIFSCFTACGNKKTKEIVLFPYAGYSIDAKEGAVFTSSDKTVVSVDDSGLVVAIKPGTAIITVKEGKKSTHHTVTVLNPDEYLTLYDCRSITLKHSELIEKLDEKKKSLLLANATWEVSSTAASKDDRVTIDYEGKVNEKSFEGSKATDYQMILGAEEFIEGFEEGILGRKAGDEIIMELKFPESYTKELAGKPVTFTVKIKKVERPNLPAFDNDFVKEHTNYEDTLEFDAEEYKNIKISLTVSELIERSKMTNNPPKEVFDHYFDQYILRLQTVLYYEYGQSVNSLKEILKLLDTTEKELRTSAQSQLEISVKESLVFHTFAYKNSILITEEEFAKGTATYISENGYNDLEDLLSTSGLTLADIREVVLIDYISPKIADMVTVE